MKKICIHAEIRSEEKYENIQPKKESSDVNAAVLLDTR